MGDARVLMNDEFAIEQGGKKEGWDQSGQWPCERGTGTEVFGNKSTPERR